MAHIFRVTLAQLNPTVGDLAGNAEKAYVAWQQAKSARSDYVVLPEMFITGYSTQDLVFKPAFYKDAIAHIEALARRTADGPAIGIGGPWFDGEHLYNAYHILRSGIVMERQLKRHLPNYAVFDEVRQFASADLQLPYSVGGVRIGSPICEDAWFRDAAEAHMKANAEMLVVPNGSPYYRGKFERRMSTMVNRVVETGLPLVYVNTVGGQDDQMFDGGSFVINPGGATVVQLPLFQEAIEHVEFRQQAGRWIAQEGVKFDIPSEEQQDYQVMVETLRDYMAKTGFKKVVLGLSGGIDSALVAAIAVDALGRSAVRCVMLPSEYTSQASLDDAAEVAKNLQVRLDTVSISGARAAVGEALAPLFEGTEPDVTEENIQSRLRGVMLMAISNKYGEMLLTTGNKSEVAVGYATIYGDMAGGYNPLKDLYKTRVFKACRWRNENYKLWMRGPKGAVIPESIINKPPSAELRPDQKDSDSLPPYDVLDGILEMLVDQDASVLECVAAGYDRDVVKRIEHLLYISEYKRFQSAPGARLTNRAFWLDRRYPIVNRWRDPS